VIKALCVIKDSALVRRKKKRRGGGRSRPQGEADRLQLRVDARTLGLIRQRAHRAAATEVAFAAAWRRTRGRSGPGRVGRKIHSDNGKFAADIGVKPGWLPADAEISLGVRDDRSTEELVPEGSGD
jgi:hypothetical protein